MTHRVSLPGGSDGSDMVSSWSQQGQAEGSLKETLGWALRGEHRPPRPHASPSSSEPNLITAYAGHTVDVAQHGETDESSAGEEAAGLGFQKLWTAAMLSHWPLCCFSSEIRSEVIELKVGGEGHVLPRQAHVIQFQVVGVTRYQ